MTASVDILAGGIRQTFTNQQMGWAVSFEGSIERTTEDITSFFGIPREGTPFEIHLAAAALALSGQTVAEVLGGTPIVEQSAPTERESERKSAPAETKAETSTPATENDPWAEAEGGKTEQAEPAKPEETRSERQILVDTIGATTSIDSLKRLYIENRATFDADAELMDTWKARGRELKK